MVSICIYELLFVLSSQKEQDEYQFVFLVGLLFAFCSSLFYVYINRYTMYLSVLFVFFVSFYSFISVVFLIDESVFRPRIKHGKRTHAATFQKRTCNEPASLCLIIPKKKYKNSLVANITVILFSFLVEEVLFMPKKNFFYEEEYIQA